MLARLILGSISLVPAALAQRVWIVDSANGPGTHFRDLPPAIAAAANGDLIRLRGRIYPAPFYNAAPITRSLSIVADWSTGHQPSVFGSLDINGLAAGSQVIVKDAFYSDVTLRNNQGRVLLDRIESLTFVIQSCAQVQMHSCSMVGTQNTFTVLPGAVITSATVAMTDCVGYGVNAWRGPFRPLGPAAPAMTATGSTLILTQCALTGGDGGSYMNSTVPDQPALNALNCELTIGGSGSRLRPGQGLGGVSPIVANGGRVTIDPRVPLGGGIGGNAIVLVTPLAALTASCPPLGGSVTAKLESQANDLVIFFSSRSSYPLSVPGLGALWLDPGRFFFVGAALQGPAGRLHFQLPLARDPILPSQAWTLQALTVDSAGLVRLSGPAACATY